MLGFRREGQDVLNEYWHHRPWRCAKAFPTSVRSGPEADGARTGRGHRQARTRVAGTLQVRHARPRSTAQPRVAPDPRSDRNHLRPARRMRSGQAGVGAGRVASQPPVAAQSAEPHDRRPPHRNPRPSAHCNTPNSWPAMPAHGVTIGGAYSRGPLDHLFRMGQCAGFAVT